MSKISVGWVSISVCLCYQPKLSMFDSEFSDDYERAAASALRDVVAVSPKTFKKSGLMMILFTVMRRNLPRPSVI